MVTAKYFSLSAFLVLLACNTNAQTNSAPQPKTEITSERSMYAKVYLKASGEHDVEGRGDLDAAPSARCRPARAATSTFASDVVGPGMAGAAGRDPARRPPRRDAADRHSRHDHAMAPRHHPPPMGAPVAPWPLLAARRYAATCGLWYCAWRGRTDVLRASAYRYSPAD